MQRAPTRRQYTDVGMLLMHPHSRHAHAHSHSHPTNVSITYFHNLLAHSHYGIELLEHDTERSWSEHHTLCMGLYKLWAELQNLSGIFTDPPCEGLLLRLEKAEIYILLHDRHEAEVIN
jgi:hypothetical protein